jgi:hypothetical protein
MQRKDKDEQNLIGDVHPRRINQADSLNAEALQLCQPVGRGAEIKPRPEHAKERYNTKDPYAQRGREVHERHRLSADSLRGDAKAEHSIGCFAPSWFAKAYCSAKPSPRIARTISAPDAVALNTTLTAAAVPGGAPASPIDTSPALSNAQSASSTDFRATLGSNLCRISIADRESTRYLVILAGVFR